jgi:hypothetical protein
MQETPRRWPRPLELAILTAATLACLLPFARKAYHVDDTLFVWAAQHIREHPLDFYGFDVEWYRTWEPMARVTQNPPAMCYYLAAVGSLFGWDELGLHLAVLLPTIGLIWGTYVLAGRFGVRPMPAAMLTLFTPATLVCASSVMCDVPMLCLWVWSVIVWDKGLRERRFRLFVLGGILIALTTVTKYFGVSLIPLLAVYSFAVDRGGFFRWIGGLFIAVALLAGYQWAFRNLYGQGGLTGAIGYATGYRAGMTGGRLFRIFEGIGYLGACIGIVGVATVPLNPRGLRVFVALMVCPAALLATFLTSVTVDEFGLVMKDSPFVDGGVVGPQRIEVFWQFLLWVAAGTGVLLLAIDDLWTQRDAIGLLLFLWVLGTALFAVYVNWAINGRSVVPLAPAIAILILRRMQRQPAKAWVLPAILLPSVALAVAVTYADFALANANRTAADELVQQWKSPADRPTLFQGHWGFQYYCQAAGAKPWDFASDGGKAGDYLLLPFNNCMTKAPDDFAIKVSTTEVPACSWAATNVAFTGAGFYASNYEWRPLPFTFTAAPPETYYVFRLTKDQKPVPVKK